MYRLVVQQLLRPGSLGVAARRPLCRWRLAVAFHERIRRLFVREYKPYKTTATRADPVTHFAVIAISLCSTTHGRSGMGGEELATSVKRAVLSSRRRRSVARVTRRGEVLGWCDATSMRAVVVSGLSLVGVVGVR